MKYAIILGTRPEIIKLSPVIAELNRRQLDFDIIHTNQHYSDELDAVFFQQLQLPEPTHNLRCPSGTHGTMTGFMIEKIESILTATRYDWVVVQGDTNSVLAGTLAASKISNCRIAHVEAGLRSYDRSMPEEINRVVTDHLSQALFAPTQQQQQILLHEGIEPTNIHVVGNTIVDAVIHNNQRAKQMPIELPSHDFGLLTLHRPTNVDDPTILEQLLKNVNQLAVSHNLALLFPVHPRTQANIERFNIQLDNYSHLRPLPPLNYFESLRLIDQAQIVLTDSGGIQEEACILQTPCLTLRENTERPETIEVGANVLVGHTLEKMQQGYDSFSNRHTWNQPFGTGDTGQKIVEILSK